ncbi:hypothetical protein ACIPSA_48520 [Streptomyces sp. NPDC086549]|uniref:hypothetical protein n=1 Tax=Streptomyces sp. NPDC086549 TaxID=3365752 RepID=UPI003822CE42
MRTAGREVYAGRTSGRPSSARSSPVGHQLSPVVFDDLDYRYRPYDPWSSYGQSKSAVTRNVGDTGLRGSNVSGLAPYALDMDLDLDLDLDNAARLWTVSERFVQER